MAACLATPTPAPPHRVYILSISHCLSASQHNHPFSPSPLENSGILTHINSQLIACTHLLYNSLPYFHTTLLSAIKPRFPMYSTVVLPGCDPFWLAMYAPISVLIDQASGRGHHNDNPPPNVSKLSSPKFIW